MSDNGQISDEELAEALMGKASLLERGERERDQVVAEIAELLAGEESVEARVETLKSRGRMTFGVENEHAHGRALFVPLEEREE